MIVFYKFKGEDDVVDFVEDEKVDLGLEVFFLFIFLIYFIVVVLYKIFFLNLVNLNVLYERISY